MGLSLQSLQNELDHGIPATGIAILLTRHQGESDWRVVCRRRPREHLLQGWKLDRAITRESMYRESSGVREELPKSYLAREFMGFWGANPRELLWSKIPINRGVEVKLSFLTE